MEEVLRNPWVRAAIALLLGIVFLWALGYLIQPVLFPLFLAFVLAYIFDPVADAVERRGFSRTGAVVVICLTASAALVAIPIMLLPGLIHETTHFADAVRNLEPGWVERQLERLPLRPLFEQLGWVAPDAGEVSLRSVLAERISTYIRGNVSAVLSSGAGAGQQVAGIVANVSQQVVGTLIFVGNIALFLVVAIYLLKDFDYITATLRDLTPPQWRPKAFDVFRRIDLNLRAFLRGQSIVCAVLFVMYGIGLWLSDTPFAWTIALVGGAASFIPFVGPLIMVAAASLVTSLEYGVLSWNVAGVLITWAVAQGLEGNVITPNIIGKQVGLAPVWVLLAAIVFGTAFGFIGVLFAVPLAAVAKVLVEEAIDYYKNSALFLEGSLYPEGAASESPVLYAEEPIPPAAPGGPTAASATPQPATAAPAEPAPRPSPPTTA